ncbi:trypsin-like peptidase domain-containing protein [Pseudonocardia sp.]|uniref:S1C family serine protease n=1 Tax=Pseudonocardia sp. TaxID=60912 RepID=UPI003D09E98A
MTHGHGSAADDRRDPPGASGPQAATGVPTYVDPIDGTPVPPPPGSADPSSAGEPGTPPTGTPATTEEPARAASGGAWSPWQREQESSATRTAELPPPAAPPGGWPDQAPPAQGSTAEPPPPAGRASARSGTAGSSGRGRTLVIGLVAGLLGGLLGGVVGHQLAEGGGSVGVLDSPIPEPGNNAPPGAVEAVAARLLPSVVQIRVRSGSGGGEGSGMILSPDGLVLTNNHVIDEAAGGATLTAVFQDGRTAAAQIVGRDPSSDIAVIRVQGVSGLTPIELGNSDAVRVGQQVVAIGSPLGLGGSVTSGIISAVDRAVNVGPQIGATDSTVLNALQTDAAINPGNSGGPLVDMQGRVIGVNSAIATTGGADGGSIGVGFSIPINQAHRVAKELESTGVATRAVLGVNVAVRDEGEGTGAVVGQVTPGGPAQLAGIVDGEVITRVDDRVITNGDELVAAIRDHAPGDQVTLVVNGRLVQVTLGSKTG